MNPIDLDAIASVIPLYKEPFRCKGGCIYDCFGRKISDDISKRLVFYLVKDAGLGSIGKLDNCDRLDGYSEDGNKIQEKVCVRIAEIVTNYWMSQHDIKPYDAAFIKIKDGSWRRAMYSPPEKSIPENHWVIEGSMEIIPSELVKDKVSDTGFDINK